MEFISGGDCFSLLQSIGFLDESLARVYAAELVLAVDWLHQHVCIAICMYVLQCAGK
jgi:serine/threonine protein kinase